MSAPSAKVRKRAAVQSLRVLAEDVGIDMIGKSRQPDMSKEEFEKLHKEVLSVATQEEHIAKSPNSWFLSISGAGPRRKKKTGNLVARLGALMFQSAHTLWARTWHTMLQAPCFLHPSPHLIVINIIWAKAGEGSSAARLPETAAL